MHFTLEVEEMNTTTTKNEWYSALLEAFYSPGPIAS